MIDQQLEKEGSLILFVSCYQVFLAVIYGVIAILKSIVNSQRLKIVSNLSYLSDW